MAGDDSAMEIDTFILGVMAGMVLALLGVSPRGPR